MTTASVPPAAVIAVDCTRAAPARRQTRWKPVEAQAVNEAILLRLQAGDRQRLATLPDDALPAGVLIEHCPTCRTLMQLAGRSMPTATQVILTFVCPEHGCSGGTLVRNYTVAVDGGNDEDGD